ncbi:MAG: enoyl-CoA hydratase/isomerase family protein [Planctomycetota bacterium]
MADATTIEVLRRGDIAEVSLVPPTGKPPTLDGSVLDALDEALSDVERTVPRLVVVRSAVDRYFCVGANIDALQTLDAETIGPWVRKGHDVLRRLERLPMPTIARVCGHAVGGGLELALACDLIFCDASARLGLTEASLGFVPGWGGTRRLPDRVGAATAKRLFFVADVLDGQAAKDVGLVDALHESPTSLDASIAAYARRVCEMNAASLAAMKAILNDASEAAHEANRKAEAHHSAACVRDPDAAARLSAFLGKRSRNK